MENLALQTPIVVSVMEILTSLSNAKSAIQITMFVLHATNADWGALCHIVSIKE